MATMDDPQLLDILQKDRDGAVATSEALSPWQEPVRSLPAAPEGFGGGSWASSWMREPGVLDASTARPSGQREFVRNQLGLPGFPEVNFRPYDRETNRVGARGPSFVGRPVSFSFWGPTGQCGPMLDIQWVATDNSSKPGQGDVLTIDKASPRTTPASGVVKPVYSLPPAILWIYGSQDLPASGLYLTIPMTGEPGEVSLNQAGLGDWTIGSEGTTERDALRARSVDSRYELFRVVEITNDGFVLDPGKRLATHFQFPGSKLAIARLVHLLRPEAARLVALPSRDGSGRRTRSYAFVPPARSLPSDLQPPDVLWTYQDPGSPLPWAGNPVQTYQGQPQDYGDAEVLPVRRPVGNGTGHLQGETTDPTPLELPIGRWAFFADEGNRPEPGQVVRVHKVEKIRDASIWSAAKSMVADPGLERLTGWFEVNQIVIPAPGTYLVVCRRLIELDPATGMPFDASTDAFWLDGAVAGQRVKLTYTIHPPVSSLWTTSQLDVDALESTRLRPLLPPSLAGRSVQGWPDVAGTTPHRADRVAINTATANRGAAGSNADPGSLLELGFRVVLYPARVSKSGTLEPDFDRPISSREVNLNLSEAAEPQWWEVDYAEGILRLSHEPQPGPSCELCPDPKTLLTADNPRREVVVFASFVPASVENEGSVELYGAVDPNQEADPCGSGGFDTAPPFSGRIALPVSAQTITVPAFPDRIDILLDADYSPIALPPSGVVDLVAGPVPEGPPLFESGSAEVRASAFHYESYAPWGGPRPKIKLVNCSGGGVPTDSKTVSSSSPAVAVLRHHYARNGANPQVDYRFDLAYGHAARAKGLRFPGAKVTWHGDGTASIDARTHESAPLFHDLFAPNLLQGCRVSVAGGLVLTIDPGWALIKGRRVPVRSRIVVVPDATTSYVYLDGTDPCDIRPAISGTARPLPHHDDVLLAKVRTRAGSVQDLVDLRYPLREVDYRLDVVVGQRPDLLGYGIPEPHFSTVGAALRFVGELVFPEVGLSGYQVRILVVGPTFELEVPLAIPCDGIVIQGVATSELDRKTLWGVTWDHPDKPLFDLNLKNEVLFRDLLLRYHNGGQPPNPTPARVAFTNGQFQPSFRTILDNVVLEGEGAAHGFLGSFAPSGGFNDLVVKNCLARGITDFGVWVNHTEGRTIVDTCQFIQGGGPQTTVPNRAGVTFNLGGSLGNVVTNTQVSDFELGFFTDATADVFSKCAVRASRGPGFVVGPGARRAVFTDCVGDDVASNLLMAPRVGFMIFGGQNVSVKDCQVSLTGPRPGDLGLLSFAPRVRVTDLVTNAGVNVGPMTTLTRVRADQSFIQTSGGCAVTDCEADRLFAGSSNRVRNFTDTGSGSLISDGSTVESSLFQQVSLTGSCRLLHCDIREFNALGSQGVHAVSCSFRALVRLPCDHSGFLHCSFDKNLTIEGHHVVVDACEFGDRANLLVASPVTRSQYVALRGNFFSPAGGGIFLDGDYCEIDGNRVLSFESTSGLALSIVAVGEQLLVRDNRALFGITVGVPAGTPSTSEALVSDNWASSLSVRAPRSIVANNSSGALLLAEDCVLSGGRYTSVEVLKSFAVISGSHVSGPVTMDGGTLVQSGCRVEGQIKLSATGTRSVLAGNHLAAVNADNHVGTVLTGNSSGAVSANSANQSILTGNSVISGGIAAKATSIILVGNASRGADILLPKDTPASFIVVGNSARNIAADGGGDPDPTPPQKSMVTGNRAGLIFGGSPDGQGRRNNVGT